MHNLLRKTNYIKLMGRKGERIMNKSHRSNDKSYTSQSIRIPQERNHSGGNFIFNSGNANVIIISEATQTSRNTHNKFPEGIGGPPNSTYNVFSSGNGGSPYNAGGGNPVFINYLERED